MKGRSHIAVLVGMTYKAMQAATAGCRAKLGQCHQAQVRHFGASSHRRTNEQRRQSAGPCLDTKELACVTQERRIRPI